MKICHLCAAQLKSNVLIGGWKELGGAVWCKKCWRKSFVIRACQVPVAPLDDDWDALRPILKTTFGAATRLANWTVRELAKADIVRMPDMKKLPPMPRVYLYSAITPAAVAHRKDGTRYIPVGVGAVELVSPEELPSSSISSMLNSIEKTYRERRFEIVWLGAMSLPSFRYPQPYVAHNRTWSIKEIGDRMVISLPLGGERRSLKVVGGREWRRQMKMLSQLASGEAIKGELALIQKPAHKSDHRPNASTSNASPSRLICKVVGWFRKEEKPERKGAFVVTTSASDMLVGLVFPEPKDGPARLWEIHGDHVRRWATSHRFQLDRWSDDSKMELRKRGRRVGVPFADRRIEAARKFNHRMSTAVDQFVAQIVGFAKRQRFAEIRWVPSDQKFVSSFRWEEFTRKLIDRAAAVGIQVVEAMPKKKSEK